MPLPRLGAILALVIGTAACAPTADGPRIT